MATWQLSLDRSKESIPEPLGYSASSIDLEDSKRQERDIKELKEKKAWDLAKSPGKTIFTTVLFLFLTGSGLNIFTIISTAMFLFNAGKAIAGMSASFAPFEVEGLSLIVPKLMFIALNLVTLLAILYKLSIMGLVPTTAEDWIFLITPSHVRSI